MNVVTIIVLLGISQGVFLGIFLVTYHRGNRPANRMLGTLMILISVSMLNMILVPTGLYKDYPHLIIISHPFFFLIGPFTWLYVQFITNKIQSLRWNHLFHAVPFILFSILLIPFFIMSGHEKSLLIETWSAKGSPIDSVIMPIQLVQLFIYLFLSYKQLQRHDINVRKEYSSIEKMNLKWIRSFIMILGGIFFIVAILYVLSMSGIMERGMENRARTIGVLAALAFYVFGYRGLRQPEIMTSIPAGEEIKKYDRSSLTNDKAEEYARHLQAIMENEKPYLKNTLTLKELSTITSIPVYHLSQIINERFQMNFYDFINQYRVEEVQRQIADPKNTNYTLMALALDSGFNSKSVFNEAFREQTGMTPSAYRKREAKQGETNGDDLMS